MEQGQGPTDEVDTKGEHVDGRFAGKEGFTLYWQGWVPPEPRATVVIAHGAAEHGGRYAHVAERLNAAGFAVYAIDHRGHGRSEGGRARIGRVADVVADLGAFIRLAGERHPDAPVFLLGHSMGGLIALGYALEAGEDLAGLVLSAASVDVSAVSPPQVAVAKVIARVAPNLGFIQLDSGEVSRDPAVVHDYETDPLNFRGKIPARTAVEIITSAKRFQEQMWKLRMPLLVIHGGDDKLIALAGSGLVHDRATSSDKTFKIYDDLYHEVLNEPEKEAVIGDVVEWLTARS